MLLASVAILQKWVPKLLNAVIEPIAQAGVEKAKNKGEQEIKKIEIQERTRQLELNKEIAEKGLQEKVATLQVEQEKTKQVEVQAAESTYNTFAENVSKQTQYNVNKLTPETNNYIATFRPKITETLLKYLQKFGLFCLGYYAIIFIAYTVATNAGLVLENKFTMSFEFMFPVFGNMFSFFLGFPLYIFILFYEQWSYMVTYWFLTRDEEKIRIQKKK